MAQWIAGAYECGRRGGREVLMSGKVRLRQAADADAPAILTLTRAAYAKWVPVIGREPKPMTADYAAAVRDHRIDLLYLGDDLAALIETIREADHLLIENVAVAPAFQGRGFGRRRQTPARWNGTWELRHRAPSGRGPLQSDMQSASWEGCHRSVRAPRRR